MHTKNGGLGRVDDGRTEHGAEHASVGDGERAAVHVLNRQTACTRLLAESIDGGLDVGEVHALHVPQHRDDKTL